MIGKLKTLARKAAIPLLYWSGAAGIYQLAARPRGAVVLMYHSVAPNDHAAYVDPANRLAPEAFERQMAFLRRHRRVVPLSQVVDQVAAGASPPAGTVCITFDDGYLDNLTVAAPILERHGLPATLFLATGYVGRGESQWSDVLHWMLESRSTDALNLPGDNARMVDLASPSQRTAVRRALHRALLEATYPERRQLLDEVARQVRPRGSPPRLTLTWDEARELVRRYPLFEIGGHTRDHLDLRTHRDERARAELEGCAADLRRELRVAPRHFSFPYGRACDSTRALALEAGWTSLIAAGHRMRVDATGGALAISRGETPASQNELRFMTSGAYPDLLTHIGLNA